MKKLAFSVVVMSWVCWQIQGCASIATKNVVRTLENTAVLATGPCGSAVLYAVTVCKAQSGK